MPRWSPGKLNAECWMFPKLPAFDLAFCAKGAPLHYIHFSADNCNIQLVDGFCWHGRIHFVYDFSFYNSSKILKFQTNRIKEGEEVRWSVEQIVDCIIPIFWCFNSVFLNSLFKLLIKLFSCISIISQDYQRFIGGIYPNSSYLGLLLRV